MKKLSEFQYSEEVTKSLFLMIVITLITAPITGSPLISFAVAEIFCALAFMPKLNESIPHSKKINLLISTGLPILLLIITFLMNISIIVPLVITSIIAVISMYFTKKSINVFHCVGMILFPVLQFIAIEGSRNNLSSIFESFKSYLKTENSVYVFLIYAMCVGILYALYNISFLVLKNKKSVFSVFGIISIILCFANAMTVLFLGKTFTFSVIPELINFLGSITDWTIYLNSTTLFNTSVISAVIFAILYFPFSGNFTAESSGFLTGKERLLRAIFGIALLLLILFSSVTLISKTNELGILLPTTLLTEFLNNIGFKFSLPLII